MSAISTESGRIFVRASIAQAVVRELINQCRDRAAFRGHLDRLHIDEALLDLECPACNATDALDLDDRYWPVCHACGFAVNPGTFPVRAIWLDATATPWSDAS